MNRTIVLSAVSILAPGTVPDVSFVPPLARRRLSPLQKIYFALAHAVERTPVAAAVFASRDGEDTLTRRLVDDFHADGSVSPNRFSSSVYNAAPGLWSIQTANRSPYTALAAGDDTVECGLLEALAGADPTLFVFAEETGGGFGAGVVLSSAGDGRRVRVTSAATPGGAVDFAAWAAFLRGERSELTGNWLSLRDEP